ncbi:MAG: biopolymer transporter ExbD [Pirellulaceae bacterium]|nr:biopolymer transporter ExbD [Pirellulaceae bacterium]
MKIKKANSNIVEGDMTPMIDMTFQLIAFFMVLINFTQSEQNERIMLPDSELAKPPDAPLEYPITLHLTKEGTVIIGGEEVPISGLQPYLSREANVLRIRGKPLSDATIIIRGHKDARTGKVQELIKECQMSNFEKFALRAKEDVGN